MAATKTFSLHSPTKKDLETALRAWREERSTFELEKGTIWFRVVGAPDADEAERRATQCYASRNLSRFSPLQRGKRIVASAYAGKKAETALWEAPLRNLRHARIARVPARETRNRFLVQVEATRALNLLDIRRPLDNNLVSGRKQAPALTAAPNTAYPLTRGWAQKLYDTLPHMHGIVYQSYQTNDDCIVLFQSASRPVFDVRGKVQALRETPVRQMLIGQAARLGAGVDFEDPMNDYDV